LVVVWVSCAFFGAVPGPAGCQLSDERDRRLGIRPHPTRTTNGGRNHLTEATGSDTASLTVNGEAESDFRLEFGKTARQG
jgi:hypothetical protein